MTSLPLACRGLTRAQVNLAVGNALRVAAAGPHGKARQRARIAALSHFLQRLVTVVPPPGSHPASAAHAARLPGRTALGLIALGTWLVTLTLGLWMLVRGAAGRRRLRSPSGRAGRPPALSLAHLALAGTGLLVWIAYLVSGVATLAWVACALLLPTAGLGMALVFLLAGDDRSSARRPPVVTIGAHVTFAMATILLAFLTAVSAR